MTLIGHFKEPDMNYFSDNYVRIAVDRLGGTTKVSNLLGVANNTVNTWINKRRVSNIDHARRLAELAKLDVQQLRSTP